MCILAKKTMWIIRKKKGGRGGKIQIEGERKKEKKKQQKRS